MLILGGAGLRTGTTEINFDYCHKLSQNIVSEGSMRSLVRALIFVDNFSLGQPIKTKLFMDKLHTTELLLD